MRLAVAVAAFGEKHLQIAEATHPEIKRYAEKCGAEFVSIGSRAIPHRHALFEKFQVGRLLSDFDRVLWIDTDIIVRKDCPNLFEVVPPGKFGAMDEWVVEPAWRGFHVPRLITTAYAAGIPFPEVRSHWNSGVFVADRVHAHLLDYPTFDIPDAIPDQMLLNVRIASSATPCHDIGHRFNHLHRITKGFDRLGLQDCYMLHYACFSVPDRRFGMRQGEGITEFFRSETVRLNSFVASNRLGT